MLLARLCRGRRAVTEGVDHLLVLATEVEPHVGDEDDEHLVERQRLHAAVARPRRADGRALHAVVVELAVPRVEVFVAQLVARVLRALAQHDAVGRPVEQADVGHLLVERREGHLVARVARAQARHPGLGAVVYRGRAGDGRLHGRLRDALAAEEGTDVARKDALQALGRRAHVRSSHRDLVVLGEVLHAEERVVARERRLAVRAPEHLVRVVQDGRERLGHVDLQLGAHLLKVELQVLERAERLEALGARHARHERVHHVQLRPVAVDRVGADGRQLGALAQDEGERRRAERLRLRVHLLARAVVAALAERHLVVDWTQASVRDTDVASLVVARREDGAGVDATNRGAHAGVGRRDATTDGRWRQVALLRAARKGVVARSDAYHPCARPGARAVRLCGTMPLSCYLGLAARVGYQTFVSHQKNSHSRFPQRAAASPPRSADSRSHTLKSQRRRSAGRTRRLYGPARAAWCSVGRGARWRRAPCPRSW